MAQFTVRNIEEDVKTGLKQRATRHGTSMEAEIRMILRSAVRAAPPAESKLGFGSRVASRFAKVGLTEPWPELQGQGARPVEFEK